MSELKPCPCGKEVTRETLGIQCENWAKWAYCYCPCGDWNVEFRNKYGADADEIYANAARGWNDANRASGWISVEDRLPDVVRGVSYQTWTTAPVLVIHSDRNDYPITAHMLACKGEPESAGMAIRPKCQSEFDWVWWYPHPGGDLRNPFGLKDQDYERYSSSRFGHCITHWQPLPEPPK